MGSDKGRSLQAQEMKRRRFVIAAPGGTEMLPLQDVVTPFMSGQMSLADALQTREKQAQEVMDQLGESVGGITRPYEVVRPDHLIGLIRHARMSGIQFPPG